MCKLWSCCFCNIRGTQVASSTFLVSAKRTLTEEGLDYDVEYAAVSPSASVAVSPTGSTNTPVTVPTQTNTTTTENGTVVTTQSTYSNLTTVPAVKMAATLSAYATVADFTAAEQTRVRFETSFAVATNHTRHAA